MNLYRYPHQKHGVYKISIFQIINIVIWTGQGCKEGELINGRKKEKSSD
jgi:hypothetical protein